MRNKGIILTIISGLLIASFAFAGDKYKIDTAHSFVGFSVKHLVISNVKGKFNDFSGKIMFDEEDITNSSVDVTIKTASIDTDHEKR
ncbi:hypothetical protein GWN42_05275, partial [candidate division KSB1 bacterium]|nr:hypothetical protein [candidate division KSB1 bacterium]